MSASVRIRRSVFDRLFFDPPSGQEGLMMTYTVDQLRDSVARDLECLLNSRAFLTQVGSPVPVNVERSVACFGVGDFSGYVLSSYEDRRKISQNLSRSIERHEPRLRQVEISFVDKSATAGALNFNIKALLVVNPAKEAVSFDAVLQPAVSKYKVSHAQLG